MPKVVNLSEEQIDQLVLLYTAEHSLDTIQLSKRFGVGNRRVCQVLRERGVLREPGREIIYPILNNKKQCSKCKQWKSIKTNFPQRRERPSLRHLCNACNTKTSVGRIRKRKYGITPEQYDQMFARQDGKCAICGNPEQRRLPSGEISRALAVDHDHITGKVRGLLCTGCNKGIGHLREDFEVLKRAYDYLLLWRETSEDAKKAR